MVQQEDKDLLSCRPLSFRGVFDNLYRGIQSKIKRTPYSANKQYLQVGIFGVTLPLAATLFQQS
jgi:hypothetical protein